MCVQDYVGKLIIMENDNLIIIGARCKRKGAPFLENRVEDIIQLGIIIIIIGRPKRL